MYTLCMDTMKDMMPESEKMYRMYERLESVYALNYDWTNALAMKWGLAAWGQKGGN